MARRRTKSHLRKINPDPVYGSVLVSKFINAMTWDGKKSNTQRLFYKALEEIKANTGEEGIDVFNKAINTVKPSVEVKSKRVGGSTYQVPVEVYSARKKSLAIRWIIKATRQKDGKTMAKKLAAELTDASRESGGAYKKREEVKRMAEANRAFSHYAW